MAVTWIEPTVQYDVEVAFDANPWDTSPVYTSIGARVRYLRTFRGKTSVNSEFAPASAEILLDSRDRLFDSKHAAGTFFGKLNPMKRVRITITYAAVTYVLFTGWTLGWQQDQRDYDNTCRLSAADSTAEALNATLSYSTTEKEIKADNPAAYYSFRDGTLTSDLGNTTLTDATLGETYAGSPSSNQVLALGTPIDDDSYLAIPEGGTGGYVYETAAGTPDGLNANPRAMELWIYDAQNLLITAAWTTTSYMKFIFSSSGWTIEYRDSVSGHYWNDGLVGPPAPVVNDQRLHHVVALREANTMNIMVDGSWVVSTALAAGAVGTVTSQGIFVQSVPTQPPPSFVRWTTPGIAHLAIYETAPSRDRFITHYQAAKHAWSGTAGGSFGSETSGARINRILDEIGHPTNLRSISTGVSTQGPYKPRRRSALELIREVERSEQGIVATTVDGKIFFRDRQWLWVNADDKNVTFSDDNAAGAVAYQGGSRNDNAVDTVRNVVTATWTGGAVTNRDTTSIGQNREHPETIDTNLPDAIQASNLSKYRLRIDKDPKSIIPRATIPMRRSIATTIPAICGLELADVVTFERTPMNVGAQTVGRHQLLGIEHELTPEMWFAHGYFGPATPMADEVPYLTLAHATRGKIGAAFGNKIPY